jgi:asparagine synthase (glutamine-hydrolysing)
MAAEKAAAVLETDGSVAQAFPVMRRLFTVAQQRALLDHPGVTDEPRADPYVAQIERAARDHPDADWMALTSFAEIRTYMHDVLLRDTDQMSMAHGLEARVPLLDHRLLEYVLGLPERIKAPRGTPKRLLVESLPDPLPSACVHRPKQGFVLPFDAWMRGPLRDVCATRLGREGLGRRGLLRPAAVESIWRSFLDRDGRVSWSRPWTLVALDAWLDETGVGL